MLVDRLLTRLLAALHTFAPEELHGFVLPEGVPAEHMDQALGPIKRKIAVHGALGRETPLPQIPGMTTAG